MIMNVRIAFLLVPAVHNHMCVVRCKLPVAFQPNTIRSSCHEHRQTTQVMNVFAGLAQRLDGLGEGFFDRLHLRACVSGRPTKLVLPNLLLRACKR